MPTYEYRCPNGHLFEKFFRSIGAGAVEVACPTCGAVGERLMSAGGGLLFKGSGFYLTDYGKNAHRKGDSSAPAAKSDGGTGGEGGSAPKAAEAPGSSGGASGSGGASTSGGSVGSAGDAGRKAGEAKAPAPAAPKVESKPASAKSGGEA